jgi:hypothetical protein
MNKHILTFALTTASIISVNATGHASFNGFSRSIQQSADKWITESVEQLSYEDQLTFLNLFVDPTINPIEATIKCIQTLQENAELSPATEQLQRNVQTFIEKYIEAMQKKLEERAVVPTQEELTEFYQKLETKVYELVAYFYQLYYEKLYVHLANQDSTKLAFMFNEQGIIAPEKRTQLLPAPTI